MTNKEKAEAYLMRLDGATLQEVADKFGVTKEWIRMIMPPTNNKNGKKQISYEDVIYPNIRKWLYDNRHSIHSFSKLICCTYTTVRRGLFGETEMLKSTIDRILDATGMSYEIAFKKEDDHAGTNESIPYSPR